MRTLVILGIRGIPAAHGGFETFAERLALWLVKRDWKVIVLCQGSATGRLEIDDWNGVQRVHVPVRTTGVLATIEFDIKSTAYALKHAGTILTLGYNTGFLAAWVRARGRRNLINMDGLEWKRDKYSVAAKAYLWINEKIASFCGDVLIADHPEILAHLARHSKLSKIVMIPYGSDMLVDSDSSLLQQFGLRIGEFFTLIARPEPENSVLEIVRAFSKRPRGSKLAILGNYHKSIPYQAKVLEAASEEVVFTGAIYERNLLEALRSYCIAYLHGHRVGGTNPSLVEALGAGTPVIAHDNPFNKWVGGSAALFFKNEEECSAHIASLQADHDLRATLGQNARQIWAERFRWTDVLEQYERTIELSRDFTTADSSEKVHA